LSLLHSRVASFFIRGLSFEPTSGGCNNMPSVMAFGLPGVTTFIECGASIASDFDGGDQHFGEGSLYNCFRVTWAPPH
jgi:hypothetical protein